jgi:signal transduction histidine kinase/response regulator of citrate/malate metabolism
MFDLTTISFSVFISSCINLLFFAVIWQLNNKVQGISVWFLAILCQAFGWLFQFTSVDLFLGWHFSYFQFFTFLSVLLVFIGLRLFLGISKNNKLIFSVLTLLYMFAVIIFYPDTASLTRLTHIFIISVMLLSINSLLWREFQRLKLGTFLFAALCGTIIVLSLTSLLDSLVFNASLNSVLLLISGLVLSSGMTLCIFILCNEQQMIDVLGLKDEIKNQADSKNRYLVTLSHELRTPLNAIIGLAQLMKPKLQNKDLRKDCDTIIDSGQSLSNLATQVLSQSSLESKTLSSSVFKTTSIIDICQSVLALLTPLANEKMLTLNEEYPQKLIPLVNVDEDKLRQILLNLIGNAIKYTQQGEVTLTLLLVEENLDQLSIRFSIVDTGIGIPETDQTLLMQPFHQASNRTNNNAENTEGINTGGVGFGLTHVDYLLTLMSSKLYFNSTENKGSIFYFDLLLNIAPKKTITPITENNSQAKSIEQTLNILVVEDIPLNQDIIKRMLLKGGHHVTITSTGKAALSAIEREPFDLVLLDMHLPDMHGLSVFSCINSQAAGKVVPVVAALTAAVTPEQIKLYNQAGITHIIKKPLMFGDLSNIINYTELQIVHNQSFEPELKTVDKPCGLLFKESALAFLKENLSPHDFTKHILDMPDVIDDYLQQISIAQQSNNVSEYFDALHKLSGYSLQLGFLQLAEQATFLQNDESLRNKLTLNDLSILAKASITALKQQEIGLNIDV